MNFFNEEDPFEDIFREFFGENARVKKHRDMIIHGEEEDRSVDFIEDDGRVFLIFELPGYSEKDISVQVKGMTLEINASRKNTESVQDYFMQKLNIGVSIKKNLPKFINPQKFKYTVKNGVIEIIFLKK